MRHLAPTLVAVLAISSTAHAAEHLMHVSEVMLSQNNNTDIRFVELADPGLEPFPTPPYKLVVYTATGTVHETVNLTVAASTQRLYIATAAADTAFTKTRDATLTMPLPVDGQACFENGNNTKIHCLAWGCVTNLVQVGASRAASPPTGQSAQRQSDGTYQIATPTADATNQAGAPTPACPTQSDAAVSPDAGTTADAGVMPDAGNNNNNNGDDGGCCQVDGSRGAASAVLLAFFVGLALRRRRR